MPERWWLGLVCCGLFLPQIAVGEGKPLVPALLSPPGVVILTGTRGAWEGRLDIPAGLYLYKKALRWEWEGEGLPILALEYPPATSRPDPTTGEAVEIYEGEIVLRLSLQFSGRPPPRGKLVLHYQACDHATCYFPARLVHAVVLRAGPGASGTADVPGGPFLPGGDDFGKRISESGLLLTYLFVFAMGVGLSFTPCIFPLIPVTIGIIGARRTVRRSQAFFLSLLYVLGISVTYAAMGVAAAATGAMFGGLLQSPWVTGSMVVMFLGLALSMFGWFDLNLPSGLQERVASSPGGYPRIFLLGLASGVVASPCVGPVIVGLLLYIGRTGNLLLGFTLLFTFAWGMGLLFVVLGTFSNLLARLPRSGAWMNEVKHGFGLLMVGMAVFYVRAFFPEILHPALWAVASLGVGALALARWKTSGVSGWPARVRGLAVALLLGFGLAQGSRLVMLHERSHPPQGPVAWQDDLGTALVEARAARHPVLIDFYADWCGACHELDRLTFGDRLFQEASREWILVRVDLTQDNPASEGLRRHFSIVGLPTVILLDPEGKERADLRVTGFVPAGEMLRRMARVTGGG